MDKATLVDSGKGTTYAVSFAEFAGVVFGESAHTLDQSRDAALGTMKATMISEYDLNTNGQEVGRDITFATATQLGRFRMYMTGNRIYYMIITTRPERFHDSDVALFFDSFKRLPTN